MEDRDEDELLAQLQQEFGGIVDDAQNAAFSGFLSAVLGRARAGADVSADGRESDSAGADPASGLDDGGMRLSARYDDLALIARGGMGEVRQLYDRFLRRKVAAKRMLWRGESGRTEGPLSRFVEEAQITGQLEHPGIVPVYDILTERDGSPVFTMQWIRGEEFSVQLRELQRADSDAPVARALDVLSRVCDAMAYAHSKGVVHRDLKPANILVGRFGEVYVTDWGLAKVVGAEDPHDLRLRPSQETERVDSERAAAALRGDSGGLVTIDGTILGTPTYMPPEQAGAVEGELDTRADVYALGAMLYEALSGSAPYSTADGKTPMLAVLAALLQGPPPALGEVAPQAPPELVAICERAMRRRPDDRYQDVGELRADLAAYLEGRVVRAYRTGPLAELTSWVRRNKALAAALVAALAIAVGGSGAVGVVQAQARVNVERLSDVKRVADLEAEVVELVPAWPSAFAALRDWKARADALVERREAHARELAGLDPEATDVRIAWRRSVLVDLLDRIDALGAPNGPLDTVQARIERAKTIEAASLEAHASAWTEAIEAIAEPDRSPLYGGLRLAPQLGLIPIGASERTGAWEFAVWGTGEVADSADAEPLPEHAIELVLVPGGTFTMGGERAFEPSAPQQFAIVDEDEELPPHPVALEPYFVGAHEVTQAQWQRLTGANPSLYAFGSQEVIGATHPVENVDWTSARRALRPFGLDLPTEAQWEHAASAGSRAAFWSGPDPLALAGVGNLADLQLVYSDPTNRFGEYVYWSGFDFDDGHVYHAPVGTYAPNPFGLYDVHGNVMEWCRDAMEPYTVEPRAGDGLRSEAGEDRAFRGGAWNRRYHLATLSYRGYGPPSTRGPERGVRAARPLDPLP